MVELEFYDPSGCLEVTQSYAPRLPSLKGKRIGFLSGDQWQAHRTLPMPVGIANLRIQRRMQNTHSFDVDLTCVALGRSG